MTRDRGTVYGVPDPGTVSDGGLAAGLGLVGLLTILIGGWGGIVPYLGSTFGYHSNGAGSWYWDWQHSLLYLIPSAVTVLVGLWLWGLAARTRVGSGRFGSGLAALVLMAAGAWFVLGPVVWPIFYPTRVFGSASATHNFLNQLGYNFGPGLIIAALGGMTLIIAALGGMTPDHRSARWHDPCALRDPATGPALKALGGLTTATGPARPALTRWSGHRRSWSIVAVAVPVEVDAGLSSSRRYESVPVGVSCFH